MRILATVIATIVVLALAGLGILFSGIYNVAATEPHSEFGAWVLSTAMRRSVEYHASGLPADARLAQQDINQGFAEFNETCVQCHRVPGRDRGKIGKGLRPRAPNLKYASERWTDAQLFWIIKFGVKMTGMPAFGEILDDSRILNIVAFVKALHGMTAEQYRELERQPEDHNLHHQQ
jgi:mono/diheme cytochrome c family protein